MASVPIRTLTELCNEATPDVQHWLTELMMTYEPECIYILHAKSFLNVADQQQQQLQQQSRIVDDPGERRIANDDTR